MIINDKLYNFKLMTDCMKLEDKYPIQNIDEERKMIEENRGNRTRLNQLLIMHNIRQAFKMCSRYRGRTSSYEDMLQRAMEGLSIAAKKFDIDKGVKFCTFAYMEIFKNITGPEFYSKSRNIDKNSTSIYQKQYQDSGSDSSDYSNSLNARLAPGAWQENDPCMKDVAGESDLKSICAVIKAKIVSNYDDDSKKVFSKIFEQNMSVCKASNELKLPTNFVLKKKRQIQMDIRKYLKKNFDVDSVRDLI